MQTKTLNYRNDPNQLLKTIIWPVIRPTGSFRRDEEIKITYGDEDQLLFPAKVIEEVQYPMLADVSRCFFLLCSGQEDSYKAFEAYHNHYQAQVADMIPFSVFILQRITDQTSLSPSNS